MKDKKLTGYPSIDKPWLQFYTTEDQNAALPKQTMFKYMFENNRENCSDIVLKYYGNRITYRNLFERIESVSRAFKKEGINEGDTVSLCALNSPETIYIIYALSRIGAICNIIEPRTNAAQIARRINDVDSKMLVIMDVFLDKLYQHAIFTDRIVVLPISQSMSLMAKTVFKLTKGKKIKRIQCDDKHFYWSEFLANGKTYSKSIDVEYRPNMPVAIIYTGGTTGVSKGALLSNDTINNIVFHQKSSNPCMKRHDSFLNIMPPFIAYGLTCGVHIPVSVGMESTLIPAFSPSQFGQLIRKYKPNHIIGVPSFWESLLVDPRMKGIKLSFIKSAIAGGDMINASCEERINSFFRTHESTVCLTKGYGLTETSSSASFTSTAECNLLGSVGIPQVKNTIIIVEPGTENELPFNVSGEICINGPTMMLGYFGNQSETEKVIRKHRDGKAWVHTQDIGYMNEDGVLFIVDRMKRMIVRPDGHNVWPSQIEAVISQHSSVAACTVVGKPNSSGASGEIPTAYIVLKDGVAESKSIIQEIDHLSKEHLPERDVALAYHFIDQLPFTPVGKVDYRVLEQLATEVTVE